VNKTMMRAAAVMARTRTRTGDEKHTADREYRPCCGKRVTFCPHGFTWIKRNRAGGINRAERRHPGDATVLGLGKALGRPLTVKQAVAIMREGAIAARRLSRAKRAA
jgi:hypothetical protein